MSEITYYQAGRQSRAAGRELARLEAQTQLQHRAIERVADLQVARVRAVGYVAGCAMRDVAFLSELEYQLATTSPLATARLEHLGNSAAAAMAGVVTDTVRRVR